MSANNDHDYYKESEFNGEWIPMTKKEIMEYCDIKIQENNMLREENKKLKSQFNNLINLIKTADNKNKINMLKQLPTLD